jgi:hypothetical protein
MTMSHHKADYLVSDPDEDLDPTGAQVTQVVAQPNSMIKLNNPNAAIGFNTFTFTLTQNLPVRLVGADPARLKMLLNTSANQDVLIGDQSTVSAGLGFNLTNHNAGGAIEINTTEEVWAISTGATALQVYLYVERTVNI